MKLLRFGAYGREKPGLLDSDGNIRDLSDVVPDIAGDVLGAESVERLRAIDPERRCRSRRRGSASALRRQGAATSSRSASTTPTTRPRPGRRSRPSRSCSTRRRPASSARTTMSSSRTAPSKPTGRSSSPSSSAERASYVGANKALDFVAGYLRLQRRVGARISSSSAAAPGSKGKGCPTFGPLGPWLVTKDEIPDLQNLAMWLDVNGERMQTGSTRTMIFDVRADRLLHLAFHDPGAGRRDHHRHPAGRRHGHEAAALPQGRRRGDARNRGPRRAAPGRSSRSTVDGAGGGRAADEPG